MRREGHYATHTQEAIRAGKSLLKAWRTALRKVTASKAKSKAKKPTRPARKSKTTRPYVRKELLKVNNQNYRIKNGSVEIPTMFGDRVKIKLASYMLEKLEGKKSGGITLTKDRLFVSYSEIVEPVVPQGWLGMDLNLDNITTYDSRRCVKVTDMTRVRHIRTKCREKVGRFRRNDHRIRKEIAGKYGKKEKDRTTPLMHAAANEIVSRNQGIIMEDLTYMKDKWKKNGRTSKKTRTKLNSWGYHILQFMVEYKARRLGLPTKKVLATGTSSKCAECGGRLNSEAYRIVRCKNCRMSKDRDENAGRNILARGLWFGPVGFADEAMVRARSGRPDSNTSVDADQSSRGSP